MKKWLLAVILFEIFLTSLPGDLLSVYKKGSIKLIPDKKFGQKTDWDLLIGHQNFRMSFLEDEGFFVAVPYPKYKIYKFNKQGLLEFEFGRKGEGPGDLTGISSFSILDNKLLIIGEYGPTRRISIFTTKGKFIKLIKTNFNITDTVALKRGRIGILTQNSTESANTEIMKYTVFIKDINSGNEIRIIDFTRKNRRARGIHPEDLYGGVFIKRTNHGNLFIAYNNKPIFYVFSEEGKKLIQFVITEKRRKVTKKDKELYFSSFLKRARNEREKNALKRVIKIARKSNIFPDYFPYYNRVILDSEENILLVTSYRHETGERIQFQVYSSDGKYIGPLEIQTDNFELVNPKGFYKTSLYCHLCQKDDDQYNLVKINLE